MERTPLKWRCHVERSETSLIHSSRTDIGMSRVPSLRMTQTMTSKMSAAERLLYLLGRPLVRCFYRVTPLGLENLPAGGFLLVPNHISWVDALVLQLACPVRSATSSTRNIITSGCCIRFCARLVASRSANASRILQFASLRKKSPKAKSSVCSRKANWNEGGRCCVCSAAMKSLRGTRRPRSSPYGSINSGDRSFLSKAGNFSGNSRSESDIPLRWRLENHSRQKQPTSRPCARSCSSWANSVSAADRHWIDILPKTAFVG